MAFLGLYSVWGWVFFVASLLVAFAFHPSVGVFLGFMGGFFVAAALGRGWRRLLSVVLYVFLYFVLTNLLALVSAFMPYAVEREDVPDPLHVPLYLVYYVVLHLVYMRVLGPRPLWAGVRRLVF